MRRFIGCKLLIKHHANKRGSWWGRWGSPNEAVFSVVEACLKRRRNVASNRMDLDEKDECESIFAAGQLFKLLTQLCDWDRDWLASLIWIVVVR